MTPLGLAFSIAAGWTRSQFVGELKLQGPMAVVEQLAPILKKQLAAQGIDPGAWQLPVFCCDELQSSSVFPVFLSRAALVQAWLLSGRTRETVPENLTVMDLRVLVRCMRSGEVSEGGAGTPWHKVRLVSSLEAYELAQELALEIGETAE